MVKLLIEYANQHQIILELNEKNDYGNYPLLEAINNNNIEIVKLLIEYANQHQIILELNEINKNEEYPLLKAITCDNIKIVKLLIDYANQHQISLKNNKSNIFDVFQKNLFLSFLGFKPEIQKLLVNYEKEKKWIK
eukprot:jgi/Orpsp1_1/1186506/evm.model.d7180000051081.1